MLINYVEKRNGKVVKFEKNKIKNAVYNACQTTNTEVAQKISKSITNKVIEHLEVEFNDNSEDNCPNVEKIQNLVETFLMKEGHYKIAKAYIIYREKHSKIRNTKNAFEDALTSMKGYLDQMDWRVNENSNMSYSLQGLNNFIVDEITSEHWLQNVYSDEIEEAHKSGDLHIHDLGLLSVYCFTGDTKIKLLDGTTPTIKELAEGKKGKEFWVYSIDDDGNIVPGKAYNARKTRINANLVEVEIDTGKKIRCTPDHKFMMRDGSYKQAKNLQENDSLMPLYSKPTNSGYETVWNFKGRNGFENYEYTHRLITNARKGEAVHHKNENKKDNRPENLTKMNDSKHRSMEIQKTMDKSDMLNKNGKRLIKMNKQKWKKKQMSDFAKNRPRDKKGRFISRGNNHKVVNVSKLTTKEDVYDIAVKKHHNFALEAGVFVHNCVGWDLKDLLLQGFRGVPTKTESKPPKHLKTAFGQVVNFFYSLQGEAAGAQALSNFDTYLAPFIAYDNLSYKEVKQAMQEFIFNINVPTRVGFQSPFTNITMDLKVPKHMKEEFVIIGGEYQERQYGEFQEEMDMLNKAFAEVMMAGDAKGRMFPFPIPTYSVTEEFDWNNETLDPVWEMTAKYGIPYWNNFINSDMDPEDTRSMCPITGDTKVLVKSDKYGTSIRPIQNVYSNVKNNKTEYKVFANGKWHKSTVKAFEPEEILELTFSNGDSIKMDSRHLQIVRTKKGPIKTLQAKDIKEGMYVPYNIDKVNQEEEYSQYNAGYAVGAYIGDGSKMRTSIVYSLSKKKVASGILEKLKKFFITSGYETVISHNDKEENVSLRINSRSNSPISWIETFITGDNAHNKRLNNKLFSMSTSFLKGVLQGWYETDGGNRGRIYTVSKELVEDFKILCNLLGRGYNVYGKDNRKERYSDNTVYTAKFHTRPSYGDWYFTENGYMWFKVDKIRKIQNSTYQKVYCFQVESNDHLFTTANGLVTHNCRLNIDNKELRKRGGGLFGANPLTGSVGVVTLNLPRISFQSENEEHFMKRIYELMDIARDSLEVKRRVLEKLTDQGLYPYSKFYLRDIKKRFNKYWSNHFSTIGLVGMNEALLNLLGVTIAEKEGNEFAEKVLNKMKEKLLEYQKDTGNLYNLEATPAEGTSYSLAKKDRERFGNEIICANQERVVSGEGEPYYTNSTQLPVGLTDDVFEALDLQDNLQSSYTGGSSFHAFIGEKLDNIETTKKLVKRIAENYKLPYYSITPTFSVCPVHGYIPGEHEYCPKCIAEVKAEEAQEVSTEDIKPLNL